MSRGNRWHLPGAALFVGLLAIAVWDCTSSGKNDCPAVPRPTAYPRIETYPRTYSDTGFPALTIEANDSAVYDTDYESRTASGLRWLSIVYPKYNATLYCTYTPVTAVLPLRQTLDNREQRMALNAGAEESLLTEFCNGGGISCRLLVTPGGTITPVQFLATDSARFVLSGSLHLKNPDCAPAADSIRPIVEAVEADVTHLLKNLRHR